MKKITAISAFAPVCKSILATAGFLILTISLTSAQTMGRLWGMATGGGANVGGVLFNFDSLTSYDSTVYNFSYNVGYNPTGNVIQATNGKLYGMVDYGGLWGYGTIFQCSQSGTVTTIHSFTEDTNDGAYPQGSLMQATDGNLYGMASSGGVNGEGVIFKCSTSGTFNSLYSFGNSASDGANPEGNLIQASDGNLYGMTQYGGSGGYGTIFKYTLSGTLTILVNFNGTNGGEPYGSLVQGSDGNLYGMTYTGGSLNHGTIFECTTSGTFTTLVNLDSTNNGANPYGSLIQASDGNLYGMTSVGGSSGSGTLFQCTTSGTITTLYNFGSIPIYGNTPYGDLIQASDGDLYGMTYYGGTSGDGTVFGFNITSTMMDTLVNFNVTNGINPNGNLLEVMSVTDSLKATCSSATLSAYARGAKSPYTYSWSNGATTSCITVTTGGTFTCTVTDARGIAVKSHIASGLLMASATGSAVVCQGNSVNLSASASGGKGSYIYTWMPGSLSGASPSVSPASTTTYTVTATDSLGCTSTANEVVTVNTVLPSVSISGASAICKGSGTTLTGSGADTYMWTGGPDSETYTIKPSATTTYTLTGTDTLTKCSNTATQVVTVNSLPSVSMSTNLMGGTGCAGSVDVLTANATGFGTLLYKWSNGSTNDTAQVTKGGIYDVIVTDGNGCADTDTQAITVNAPEITITGNVSGGGTGFCAGSLDTLMANVIGNAPFTYTWSTSGANDTILVSSANTYSVTVKDKNGCTGTASITVTKKSLPVISITDNVIGGNKICAGNIDSLTGSVSGSGPFAYNWSDGSTNDTALVQDAMTYTLTVSDANRCVNTATKAITINPLPSVSISGNTSFCSGGSDLLSANAPSAISFAWSDGNMTNTTFVTMAGTYNITVTDANGCRNSDSIAVGINSLPLVLISGNNYICSGTEGLLTANASVPVTYSWSTSGTNDTIFASSANTYNVTVTDSNGCMNTASKTVTVDSLPNVNVSGNDSICSGLKDVLTANAPSATSYSWSTGSSNDTTIVSATNTYTVTIADAAGCINTATKTVTIDVPPVSILGNNSICMGGTDLLAASAPTAVTFLWSDGSTKDTAIATSTNIYSVKVTDARGCKDSTSLLVTQYSLPAASISDDIIGGNKICDGSFDTLTVNASGYAPFTYRWSTTANTQTILVSAADTYSVVIRDVHGCADTASQVIVVNPLPTVSISSNIIGSGCSGSIDVLTANASGTGTLLYNWTDGSTQDTAQITTGGIYTVTVTDGNGCMDTASNEVIVNAPAITIKGNIIGGPGFCKGKTDTLRADIVGNAPYTYDWSTSGTGDSTVISAPATYSISVTDKNGCVGTASLDVVENPLPAVGILGASSVCLGSSTTLIGTGANTYVWTGGPNTEAYDVSPTVATTYTLTGTNSATACSDTAMHVITISPLPAVSISGQPEICYGAGTTLVASGADTYVWYIGPSTADFNVTPTVTTTYTVTGTNSSTGCSDTATYEVMVRLLPTIKITASASTICAGSVDTLKTGDTATDASPLVYDWSTGGSNDTIIIAPSGSLTYSVTVTDSIGCKNSATQLINVNPLPPVNISGKDAVCTGSSTVLSATGANVYLWSTNATTSNISVSPLVATAFSVTGTNTLTACSDIASVTVNVNPLPTITISGSTDIDIGSRDTLTASGGVSYVWTDGSTYDTANVRPLVNTTYTVTGTDGNGCKDTASFLVTVKPLGLTSISNSASTSIYPNPAVNTLNLSFNMQGGERDAVIEIMDASGKEVMRENTSISNGKNTSIDVTALAQGLYFVKVITEKNVQAVKFIKQ
ncbi:MAG: choice-of-anchor tandem repeat GloVer-containing protein [Bacteroidia bacterium]